MNQIIIICLAIISISSIYLIYQNMRVVSSFNKLSINLNKINENLIHQGQLISSTKTIKDIQVKHPNVPSNISSELTPKNQLEISQPNTNNIRNQYDNYNPTYMETDSNISDKEVDSDQNNEAEETQNSGYDIPEELKHQIENLEEYDEDDELDVNNLPIENNEVQTNETELGENEQDNNQDFTSNQSLTYLDTVCASDGLVYSEECNDSVAEKMAEALEDVENTLQTDELLPIDETILDTNTHKFESYTKENLEKLTILELKKLARENDLKVKGRKVELIDRVLNKFQQ